MRIEVRYFAAAREAAGLDGETLEVAAETTVGTLASLLAARHASLAPLASSLRYAVGAHFAGAEATLEPGDEVAVLPPVSGG